VEQQKKRCSFSLRRMLAIVLTLLALFTVFWPTMANYTRDALISLNPGAYSNYLKRGISEEDAYKLVKANMLSAGMTFNDARTYMNNELTKTHLWEDNPYAFGGRAYSQGTARTLLTVFVILLNTLFFGMLLTGLAAIVLYILNQTRIVGIVFAGLAVLSSGAIVGGIIAAKSIGLAEFAPGVGLFLLPVFAVAAFLIYQPEGGKKPKPVKAAPAPAPIPAPAPAPVAAAEPAPAAAPQKLHFCTTCGKPIEADAKFCTNCGAKQ
jgi:hypothetical protein